MAGIPAVLLSVLCLTFLCSSALGQTAQHGMASNSTATTRKVPTTEPSARISATTSTGMGANTDDVTEGIESSSSTTGTTERMTSYVMTPVSTTPPVETGKNPPSEGSSSAGLIVAALVVLLILLLVIAAGFRNHGWAGAVGRAVGRIRNRARAVQSGLGVRLWPGKNGGPGGGDKEDGEEDEEDQEDEEDEGKAGDVEEGNGRGAGEKEVKREEEEEEEDSSDDYSSMEGFDLRERSRWGEAREDDEEERGKRQGEEEEGKSREAMLVESSKEGEMEECDLTAL